MFDGLKKKFSSFIDSLSKKEAEKEAVYENENQAEITRQPEIKQEEVSNEEPAKAEAPKQVIQQEHKIETERKFQEDAKTPEPEIIAEPKPNIQISKLVVQEVQPERLHQKPAEATSKKEPKVSATTKIKGFFLGHVKISEKDADPFIESLKLGLLQSDVNYDVAEKVADSIRRNLVGREVSSRSIEDDISQGIRDSIMGVLTKGSEIDIILRIGEKRAVNQLPYKILFVGPNGAGKTTTMAKIASMLISNNITCVLSASDTFRAAAIEQTAYHASKLGINVIKGTYGADPASVAFDAIAHAKAHGIMVVLIDSAGRQETNKSLIEELKKISRVANPDLKIFIGESISGNALLEQVKAINEAVKLDGIILTKLDVDAKGGNTLSILSDTTIPILYFGTGEKYSDIIPYDPKFIVDNILPNN